MEGGYEKVKIWRVIDGDTIILDNDRKDRVRLYGIDAPETFPRKQEFGQVATDFLHLLLTANRDKEILLKRKSKDRYHRIVGILYIVDSEGVKNDVNLIMLNAGLAWAYARYLVGHEEGTDYLRAEKNAKDSKLHIWSNPNAINPSDFRNQMKKIK